MVATWRCRTPRCTARNSFPPCLMMPSHFMAWEHNTSWTQCRRGAGSLLRSCTAPLVDSSFWISNGAVLHLRSPFPQWRSLILLSSHLFPKKRRWKLRPKLVFRRRSSNQVTVAYFPGLQKRPTQCWPLPRLFLNLESFSWMPSTGFRYLHFLVTLNILHEKLFIASFRAFQW